MLQLLVVALSFVLAWQVAKATVNVPDHGSNLIKRLKENTLIPFSELCFYVYFMALTGIEQSILAGLDMDFWLITTFMITIGFWALIRSSFVMATHSSKTRYLFLGLWVIILFAFFGTGSAAFAFLRKASITFGSFTINLMFVIEAIIISTILFWLTQFLISLARHEIHQASSLSASYKVLYMKIARVGLSALAVVVGLTILGFDLTLLTVFTGALGFGLGIGLQRIFANFIAGIILLVDKSIKPGDLLQIDGAKGVVDHMNARYVSVVTRDGQNILVPNESMMNDRVHNLSFENTLIQQRLKFIVVYGSDLTLVKTLTEEIIGNTGGVQHTHAYSCLISELKDTGVEFEVRYWIDAATEHAFMIIHNILLAVTEAFKANKIEFYSYGQPALPERDDEKPKAIVSKPTVSSDDQE